MPNQYTLNKNWNVPKQTFRVNNWYEYEYNYDQLVGPLLEKIIVVIDHFSADGAYDEKPVYDGVTKHSRYVDLGITPRLN